MVGIGSARPARTAADRVLWVGNVRDDIATAVSTAVAASVTGLAYLVIIGLWFGLKSKLLEVACALLALTLVPWLVSALIRRQRANADTSLNALVAWTAACATAVVGLPAVLSLVARLGRSPLPIWQRGTLWIVTLAVVVHALGWVWLRRSRTDLLSHPVGRLADAVTVQKVLLAFQATLFLGGILLVAVEPTNKWINAAVQLPFDPAFAPGLAWGQRLGAFVAAVALVGGAALIAQFERRQFDRHPVRLRRLQRVGVPVVIVCVCAWYFDFAFLSDPMHYLTNVSPAMAVLRGGVPLVDVFSQYGPGPVLVTTLGFLVGPHTMGTANVVVQLHNLALIAVMLAAMSRLTECRFAALLLGFTAVAQIYGIWGSGHSTVNGVPSVMGFRYLWPAVMALAISFLPRDRMHSAATTMAMAAAAVWSIESLAGTLGIHLAVISAVRLRDRDLRSWVMDVARAMLPAIVSLMAFTILIRWWAGSWPSYGIYLAFLSVYNPFTEYWGVVATATFWGWAPWLLTCMAVAIFVWLAIRAGAGPGSVEPEFDRLLFRGYLPQALLTALCSTYYLGRSVDFTIMLAYLPLIAIIVPAWLTAANGWTSAAPVRRSAVALLTLAMVWMCAYGFLAFYRTGSVYRVAAQDCWINEGCSFARLSQRFVEWTHHERSFDATFYIGKEGAELVAEARREIEATAAGRERVAVFLGNFGDRSLATDLALLVTDKAHRWPVSYTFTDQLVPRLERRIVEADVKLDEGEAVIVRGDANMLTPLDTAILERIRRTVQLCPTEAKTRYVAVYRATYRASCDDKGG